jgi:glycerophosphoryl diester phosphodiesterase
MIWISFTVKLAAAQYDSFQPQTLEELHSMFTHAPESSPLIVAHRGGAYPEKPENSIAVFEHTLAHTPAIIEADFRLTQDDQIVMMHDATLDRTTTGSGSVEAHTLEEIQQLRLVDHTGTVTDQHPLPLHEVLDWARDRTIIAVDVKAPLTFERMIKEITDASAEAFVFIQTYNLEDAQRVHTLNHHLMLSTLIRTPAELEQLVASPVPLNRVVAHTGSREPQDHVLYKQLAGYERYVMVGTLGELDARAEAEGPHVYQTILENGASIISTDRPIEAAQAISISSTE